MSVINIVTGFFQIKSGRNTRGPGKTTKQFSVMLLNQIQFAWAKIFPLNGIPLHPLWLGFRLPHHGRDYHQAHYTAAIPRLRFVYLISVLFFLSFQYIDFLFTAAFFNEAFKVRFLVYLPIAALVFVMSYSRFFIDFWQYVMSIWVLLTGTGGLIAALMLPGPGFIIHMMGLMVFFVCIFLIYGLRPHVAFACMLILSVASLLLFASDRHIQPAYVVATGILHLMVLVLGYYMAWLNDFNARRMYWMDLQFRHLQEKSRELNTEIGILTQSLKHKQ